MCEVFIQVFKSDIEANITKTLIEIIEKVKTKTKLYKGEISDRLGRMKC